MTVDNIPDSWFADKRITRQDLRSAVARLNAELRSPDFADAFETDPVISEAEAERTEQYRTVIENAMGINR